MDEELVNALQVLSEYCAEHEGCKGCTFFVKVKIFNRAQGFCELTGKIPEDWKNLYT